MAKRTRAALMIIGVIVVIGVVVGFVVNGYYKSKSFPSPKAALENVQEPIIPVGNIIETDKVDSKHAFIIFYSNFEHPSLDLIGIAKFYKGKFGWRYVKMFSGLPIRKQGANGDSTGNSDFLMGLATSDVVKVKRGNKIAKLFPLNKENLKLWVIFHPNNQSQEQVQFITKNGKVK